MKTNPILIDMMVKYLVEDFTPLQRYKAFEKEIIAWFIKDIPGFEVMFDSDIKIFESDYSKPDGFSKDILGYKNCLKYIDTTIPAIFKVRLNAVKGIEDDDIEKLFDHYRYCEDKFASYSLDRVFCIGDGDDVGAVTIGENGKTFYVDIWVRSFVE